MNDKTPDVSLFTLSMYLKAIPFNDGAKSPVIRGIPPKYVGDQHERAESSAARDLLSVDALRRLNVQPANVLAWKIRPRSTML
jgi:hypothetical protein